MKRKPKKIRKRVVLLLLLVVVGLLFVQSEWLGRTIYPIYYKEEIKKNAEIYRLDPLLIASIIRVESNFKPDAVSPKGALGIMQVMPDTAEWIMKNEEMNSITIDDVSHDPNAGIQVGTWYLQSLLKQFGGNLALSLAAYNAGPGKVKQWVDGKVWDGDEDKLEDIPYGETKRYVQRVLYFYNKYKQVHRNL
ncbi:lytic transglycosylase domain-containing protein [Cohnella zeiphila]|uniref:Lytic transglycosylase domain-containing protein n=1 Tax=Cohnella zeiphila TaxID=2761120 RepID=A0A7X0SML5_9BACL|nr:lytic transglycosylase domain-containing protein [Cohnella zeiphila]MBB6732664.1 lytic transglycosylase domain-containing protein [Cohnella zeiphila]